MKAQIFLDMDGVLVAFHPWLEEWKERLGYDEEDRIRFWDLYEEIVEVYPDWWGDAPPTKNCFNLLRLCRDLVGKENVHILTAIGPRDNPTYTHKEVRKQKTRWIRKHGILRYVGGSILMVYRGEKKRYADPDHILVDDHKTNIKPWIREGGIGILYKDRTFPKHKRELIEAVDLIEG